MSQKLVVSATSLTLAKRVNLLVTLIASVVSGSGTCGVVALVDLRVGVSKLDGNVSLQLVLETDSLDSRNGLYDGGLSVSDVTDGSDVDGGLAGNNLGGEGSKSGEVEGSWVGLGGEDRLGGGGLRDSRGLL